MRLTAVGSRLLDALGREVMLRGANTGGRSKFEPFIPFPFLESGLAEQADAPPFAEAVETYYDMVASWGTNVVRMPFSWEALEPTRGTYDDTYLSRYQAMISAAESRGIRVIVDFHQDVFASVYCGDGFPLWAVPEPWPEPAESCASWFSAYFNEGPMHAAWDRFWANEDDLMDDFEAMWTHMASATWPQDAVIGFEIINEPAPGSEPEETWAPEVLTPFYSEMVTVIREAAPGALVFFDSTGAEAL
ncbi:MAG: cellulase family glycosylhydrolase, partial [Myxococcota bacterium]|nr:cellulase family glycosylhydrolase [Myxococcota bacterium]